MSHTEAPRHFAAMSAAGNDEVALKALVHDLIEDARARGDAGNIIDICNEYLKNGSYRIACLILDIAKDSFTNDAVVHELLARANHFGGDHAGEARAWQRAAELSKRIEFKVCEGLAWLHAGDYARARNTLESIRDNERFDIAAGLAECAFRQHDLRAAYKHWTHAASLDPDNANAALQRANILIELGDARTASEILGAARDRWPASALVAETRARLLKTLSDYPEALEEIQRAISLDEQTESVVLTHAGILIALKRPDDACRVLRDALARRPHDADTLAALAECEEAAGRLPIALTTWRGLVHFQPDFVRGHIAIARLENRGKSPQALREALFAVAEAYPREPEPLVAVANLALATRQKEEAESFWTRVLRVAPGRKEYWIRCAAALREFGERQKAEDIVWQALERFPDDRELLEDALSLSTGLENQAKAVAAGTRLTALLRAGIAPDNVPPPDMRAPVFAAYTSLVWLHFNVSDFEKVRTVCAAMSELWPNSAFHLEIHAMMALRERNWVQALDFARTYSLLFPNYPRGIELEYEALLGAGQYAVAADALAREDLAVRFPEWAARFSAWRDAARSIVAPASTTEARLVLDVTSLATVVAASASPGGIERTIVEVALELYENWCGNLTLVNWKGVPVEVKPADFQSAIFPTSFGDKDATRINPFARRELTPGERVFKPGPRDVVVILGSAWHYDANNAILKAYKQAGSRVAVYIHDLLQLYYPTLVSEKWATIFRNWIGTALDHSDLVMVNSLHSGKEIAQFCGETGRAAIESIKVELGDDYRCLPRKHRVGESTLSSILRLSNGAGYVLFVSAIGKRKNHGFLVRAWDRLRKTIGKDCPALVLVGAAGDGMVALEAELKVTNHAGGKVMVLHNVDDAALDQLYRNCLFTVFPSLCEGWGLPIAEALSHGKVCLASCETSMPEVGGDSADYFSPTDEDGFVRLARGYIYDAEKRAEREAQISRRYHQRAWRDTTANIVSLIENRLLSGPGSLMTRVERNTAAQGVIQVCASYGRQCGIASYTTHVAAAMREQGRETVVVRGIDECEPYLATGRYRYVLVQHEYGLYDNFNPNLAGPDSTGDLVERLEDYAGRFPGVRSAVIMHTIDMNKPELRDRSLVLFNSNVSVITLSSAAARHTKAMFVEHGIHWDVRQKAPFAQEQPRPDGTSALTVSSFGFLSPHKRIDRILQACAETGSRLVANFACDSEEQIRRARTQVENVGVAGKVTFDFQTDADILVTLRAGDVIYFPQGAISYWATTGSARVAMTAERPVVTSPEDQFEDMADGVVFATDAGLPNVLRRLANPAYYAQVADRLAAFRDNNTISNVYRDALARLDESSARTTPAGSAIAVHDLLDMPARAACTAIYSAAFGRRPAPDELADFESAAAGGKREIVTKIAAIAASGLAQGHAIDLDVTRFDADPVSTVLDEIDGERLVSAVQLLQLEQDVFVRDAMLALAKREPSDSEATAFQSILDAASQDDVATRMNVLRKIVSLANETRVVRSVTGDLRVHLYLRPAVPGAVQHARRVYRLSMLCAFNAHYLAISVYRAVLKREPTLHEYLELAALDRAAALERVREIACGAASIHLIDDVSNVRAWASRIEAITGQACSIGDENASELTGDNLALLQVRRLSRAFPSFMLPS